MIAVFYDRRNRRNVTSQELVPIELVRDMVTSDSDDRKQPKLKELYNVAISVGELGYKSENCPKIQNWDLYTNLDELVFLCLKDDETAEENMSYFDD